MKKPTAKPRTKRPLHPKESGFLPWQVLGTTEERLYATVNKLPMILFALDQDGVVTLSEGRGLKALGVKPGELVGQSVHVMYRDQPEILANAKRALAGESFTVISNLNGVFLESQFSALHDASGKFIGTVGISIDITERRRVEEALKKNEELLSVFVEHTPAAVAMFDLNMRYLRVSDRWLSDYNLGSQNIIGRSHYEVFPEITDRWKLIHKRCLAGAVEKCEEDYFVRKDGSADWIRWEIHPWQNHDAKIGGIIIFTEVITQRKRAEETLKQQKQEQQIILDSAPAMIWYKDRHNNILRCNRAAAESIGVTPDKIEGRSTSDFYPDHAEKYHKDDLEVIKSGKPKLGIIEEYIVSASDKRWVRTDKIPYRDESGNIVGVIVFALDITDRKRVEEDLIRTSSELQGIFQALPDLYFRLDSDGTILDYKTEQVADLYVSPEEFMGKRMQDVLPPTVGLQFQKGIEKVLKMRSMISFEYSLETKGGLKSFEARFSPLQNKQIVVILRNITEEKKAREDLERQRAFFRQVIDMNPNFVFAKDREGRFTLVNEAVAEAYGVPVDQLLGKTDADVNPKNEEVEHFQNDDREVIDTRKEKFIPEEVVTDASGKKRWLQTIKRPLADIHGNINQILGVATDITERKRAEVALRESEERYRLMFENNPMPMFVYDVESLQYLSVNDAAIQHYGYTRSEFLAMTIKDIRPVEDVPLIMRIISENPEQSRKSGPLRHKKKDGSIIEVEATSHRINFGGCKARVVLINDVTERQKAEQALLHSQKLESLGILAGGIAHDFNNLLMGVLGNSDLALQKLEPGSRLEVHLHQIKKASMRAAELCRQLLAYSGKGRFDVSFLDLNSMIRELTTLLELSIHKGVTLNLNLESSLPHLLGDKVQIQQVIMNMVINSSEAIGDKQGTITITTKQMHADRGYLALSRFTPDVQEGDYVLFEVKDNGCGMDAETLPRIFDPFFTTKFTGRGLGLAAVLGIVKGHGGAFKVDSTKGEGTTFKLLFPSHRSENIPTVQAGDPAKTGHEDWLGRGTILVVDDEEAVRAVSELILPTLGFSALLAADGFRACELLREHRDEVVAVMLDLTMPKMDGVKAVQELRKIKAGIKVLLMSGYDEDEAINRFTNEGFDCFLQKPFVRNQLRDKLRIAIDGK